MNIRVKHLFSALPILMTMLNGCIAIQPFPNYARSGDTITLAVGPQDGMNKANTQVLFTSDAAPSSPLNISSSVRSIFNLFADRGSPVYSPNSDAVINFGYLHREQWLTIVALDLPQDLPTGPATIQVQTTVQQPHPVEPGVWAEYPDVNTVPIRIEILPGTGAPNPLKYKTIYGGTLSGSYASVQPQRQALVKPPAEDPQGLWGTTYGAIELRISLPLTDLSGGTLTENNIRIATQDITGFTRSKLQTTWSLAGNELKVLFISSSGRIKYYEPRFSIVAENADFTATPTILSVDYFDVNGNAVNGPATTNYSISLQGVVAY
jgi:hypothetical protein